LEECKNLLSLAIDEGQNAAACSNKIFKSLRRPSNHRRAYEAKMAELIGAF